MLQTRRKIFRRKWALIIGNNEYRRSANKLQCSVKNANKLCHSMKGIKFQTVECANINGDVMDQILEFRKKVRDGDLILFYFSGHASHFEGHNYLLSTDDSRIDSGEDIRDLGTNVRTMVERLLQDKPSCIAVVILDCCKPYILGNSTEANGK